MLFLDLQNFIISLFIVIFACFPWRKIEFGIWLIVFFLPIYLLRTEIFDIPSTALELSIYILFAVYFFRNYRIVNWREIISEKMLLIGIILLMAGVVTSTLLSVDVKTSAGILKGWFFDPLLYFIVLAATVKNLSQTENILKILSLSGFAVATVSLFYWLGYLSGGVSYDSRLHAFYTSPNYLAMYLSVPFMIAIWLLLKDKFSIKKEKYFWLISALVITLPIYLTYSYAAWLAIFASVFMLIYLVMPAENRKALFISVFLILAVLFVSQSGTEKLENLKNLSYRSSANSRIMIWRSALAIGRDNPIFGIGPGNFQQIYLEYQKKFTEPYLEWAVPEPHNIFLAFWLETGILGLTGFVMIIIWYFRSGIVILKERRSNGAREVAIILLAVMVYILIHGLIDTTYWKNDLAVIFWLIIGLMVAVKKYKN